MTPQKHFFPQWKDCLLPRDGTIREALSAIQTSGALMACIVSDSGVLQAILTDSDIRRALLNGGTLEDKAWPWANQSPIVALEEMSLFELNSFAEKNSVREFPIIDREGRLVDIFALAINKERINDPKLPIAKPSPRLYSNAILIQAGGLGTRLRSIVDDRPKPLALVGDRPILETLILQAAANGFRKFYISLNYKAEMIEEHLTLPQYKDLEITTIHESTRLGTAGSIGLIADEIDEPILICNADVLTTAPFGFIVDHHIREKADITVSVRPYSVTIPFGVVEVKNSSISLITEKPVNTYLVNAGIYVINPDICRLVPKNHPLDMPELINLSMSNKTAKISPFLLHEYWIDIGQPEDFVRANQEFENIFRN